MLSIRRRIPLPLFGHLATDLGLPDDFQSNLIPRYPQYFSLSTTTQDGPTWLVLELWDPSLAISFEEKDLQTSCETSEGDSKPKGLHLPKIYKLSKKHKKMLSRFREEPFVSPYEDVSRLDDSLPVMHEKHAVAGIRELLNLTLEKRIMVDHLTHFTKVFTFSYKITRLLLKHPHLFYLSRVGNRDTVFLRDAYSGSRLLELHPLVLAKQRLAQMMEMRKRAPESDDSDEDGDDTDTDDDTSMDLDPS